MGAVVFLAVVATLAEVAIFWSAAAGHLALLLAFLLHCLLSGVVAVNILTLRSERTAVLLLAAGIFFMGPFGALGGIAMGLFGLLPGDTDFEFHRRTLGPDGENQDFAAAEPVASSGRSLISFHDVMRWGTRAEKQAALRRIAERYNPAFAGALKMALQDAAPEIRSEAAAASNAIVGQLENESRRLQEAMATPAKPSHRGQLLIRYGDAEMVIARSELVPPSRAQEARRNALRAFMEARQSLADAKELHLKTARAYYDEGALAEAARESRAALANAAQDFDEEALTTHLETLFALGRYRDIRQLLARVPASGRARRAAPLWRPSGAPRTSRRREQRNA